MAWENYGAAYVIDQRVGLDANGNLVAWDYEAWSPTLGNRPGNDTPGNVITGTLAGRQPAAFAPRGPASEPAGFNNGSNAAPSYVAGCVGGRCGGGGTIRSERVLSHTVKSFFFTGPLRSPARLQNTFAHESFMDEIAAAVKADPVAYRLRHLSHPRLIDVLKAATKAANWDARPSPKPGTPRTGVVTGRGASLVAYEGDNGYCAMVAEVAVDQDTGAVTVKRIVLAQDCGPISNPDGMRNQIEGGVLQGMSRALMEEVTWDDQKVTSVDWRSYELVDRVVGSSDNRVRSHQPSGRGGHRSGGDRHHDCGLRDRERDLRCDGSPRPPSSVHPGASQGRVAGALRRPSVTSVSGSR